MVPHAIPFAGSEVFSIQKGGQATGDDEGVGSATQGSSSRPEIREYETTDGRSPFAEWFESVDPKAAAKVTAAIARLEAGNPGDVKAVGQGVSERRIDFGPGYRVYFGQDGSELVVLLIGGTKKRQQRDIERAKEYWADYKRRKKESRNSGTDT